jgi:hypothetical protein
LTLAPGRSTGVILTRVIRGQITRLGMMPSHRFVRILLDSGPEGAAERKEKLMMLAEWGVGQLFWSMLWFFLFVIWIWLLIAVFADIFRSRDLGGGAKALWVIFVIVVPYLGVFIYLIARGHKMGDHSAGAAQAPDAPTLT